MDLWQFVIDWDKLSKSTVLERQIRPWLEEMSNEYMGGVEEKFIALVEKKLLSRSHPDKIIKIMKILKIIIIYKQIKNLCYKNTNVSLY